MQKINAIILHRTASGNVQNTLRGFRTRRIGGHFLVDRDGTVYQTASTLKIIGHTGNIRVRCADTNSCSATDLEELKKIGFHPSKITAFELKKDYPFRYPHNKDSIGIEVMGLWDYSKEVWELLTLEQIDAVSTLVNLLILRYNLSLWDIYTHEQISYKQKGEGQTVYDAIIYDLKIKNSVNNED